MIFNFPSSIPSTFDYAAGGSFGGTATPTGSILANYNGFAISHGGYGVFEEASDSPDIESSEQSTIVHHFYVDPGTAQNMLIANPRGTVLTDSQGFVSRVLSTRMQPIKKDGRLVYDFTMTCEAQSFGTPPDEFDVQAEEINPSLFKHPRYHSLTYQDRYNVTQANNNTSYDVTLQYQQLIISGSDTSPNGIVTQSLELLNKLYKGEDTFYLSGYRVVWSTYYWSPPVINPGEYIEDPVYQGGLPPQFWSTDGTVNGTNIFSQTALFNKNLYPQTSSLSQPPFGLSWLRKKDTVTLNRTWYKLTRNWVAGPIGQWDAQLYSSNFATYQISLQQGGY